MSEINKYILVDENGNETTVDIVSKVDTTLSQENIPADSKTVGDKITDLDQKISNIQVETGNKEEKKTYQWNAELLIYEPLNEYTAEKITLINGGNANGDFN